MIQKFGLGDIVKRQQTKKTPKALYMQDRYYIIHDVKVDTSNNVWYLCYSPETGASHEYLLEDTPYRTYTKVA